MADLSTQTVIIVAGLGPEPDFSTSFVRSIAAIDARQFRTVVLTGPLSFGKNICGHAHSSLHKPAQEIERPDEFCCGNKIDVVLAWRHVFFHPFLIFWHVRQRRPALVHIQHEINRFGGPIGVVLLPLLIAFLKTLKVPLVVTLHAVVPLSSVKDKFAGFFSFPALSWVSKLMRWGLHSIYSYVVCWVDQVIVLAPSLKSVLISDYGADPDKVAFIPLGLLVEPGGTQPTERSSRFVGPEKKSILCFGYILRRKGLEHLIRAFARFAQSQTDFVLVLAGTPSQCDYDTELKELVRQLNLTGDVVFTGSIELADVENLHRTCDMVVIPAAYSFSVSGPLSLAVTFEKPVVVPYLGPFVDVIEDEVSGLFYDPNDLNSLFRALSRLATDESLRQRLSVGIKTVQHQMSSRLMAQKTISLYMNVLESAKS